MTGDPPIGTEDAFPKDDPDETPEERRTRLARQNPTSTTAADTGTRADAIVRREAGVRDFSAAEAEDGADTYQIEDYPGQDDPTANGGAGNDHTGDAPIDIAARGIDDFVQAIDNPDSDERRTGRQTRP